MTGEKHQSDTGGIHGIADDVLQTPDRGWITQPDGHVKDFLGQFHSPHHLAGATRQHQPRGDHVTNDIAVALRTPSHAAEEIKKKYACALTQLVDEEEDIQVPSVGDRPSRSLSKRTLAEIVEPRMEELFLLIQAELRRSGLEDMIASGLVLTGGSSKMMGAVELAEEIFHMPVRLGNPAPVRGLQDVVRDPMYATGVGLVLFARHNGVERIVEPPIGSNGSMSSILQRMKSWFQGS